MATNKDKLIAGAQKLVEKGQFEKAIKEYLKVVADDDKDVRIWLKIGDLHVKLGKKAEAAEAYGRVAQFYSDQGFYLKAVAVYKQILKIEPRLIDVNQKLAELYKQLGLLSDAMQQYEAVAAFYHREGQTRQALVALKQIVELDPENVASRIKLAELYSKESMLREAIDELGRAAEQLRRSGRVDDFMKVAERLLFHSPDNRPVTKELAALYIDKGDPRRALPKLQVCFKADPRDTEVLSLLARAFESLDQRSKSVSVLKELARILGENGDNRGRDGAFRKILQLAPGDADAEAALSNPGRARSGSEPGIAPESLAVSPPPLNVTSGYGAAQPRKDNATGGQPVVMSPSGRVRQLEEAEPDPPARDSREWNAPRQVLDDHSTRGFQSEDEVEPTLAPPHAVEEEIAKILNETDVYIKYNLHAKAVEHLQRAFERNPRHVGAREKLKALHLILGKKDEAILELWSLVEHAEPGRKRRYLREILEIDPSCARAKEALGEPVDDPAGDFGDAAPRSFYDSPETESSDDNLDVESLEELDEDEFDIAEPSVAAYSAPSGAFEDEEIPVVVDSEPNVLRDSFEAPPVTPAYPDEPHMTAMVASHSESQAIWAGAETVARTGEHEAVPPRTVTLTQQTPMSVVEQSSDLGGAAGASFEDDLDEADFFMQQSLYDEGRAILRDLLSRYPNHPLVTAKLRDLEAMQLADDPNPKLPAHEPAPPPPEHATDLSAELPTDLPGEVSVHDEHVDAAGFEMTRRGVIERGVTAEDFETHYDLGIAYKEMGLIDDAINEFRIVMKDPAREVQCFLMIGLCHLEKGMQTDAITQFKKALYVEGITERESLSLYFELGAAYERLNDPREALYYYEKVLKRDPKFRDVQPRVEALRGGESLPAPINDQPGEELDNAFDSILDGDSR